jgi:solute carrier family 25 uncoupling protein 8/9
MSSTKAPEVMVAAAAAKQMSVVAKLGSAGVAACWAEFVTLPIDSAKVRMQLGHNMGDVLKKEGVSSLYRGLGPGLQRQAIFASLRIGLYEPIRGQVCKITGDEAERPRMHTKIIAGLASGFIGISVANPTDLIKVRMQGDAALGPKHGGVMGVYKHVIKTEGLKGLWKGYDVNVVRNSIITAAELVGYDCGKEFCLERGMEDGIQTHAASAMFAGLCASVIGNPIDTVKTRIFRSSDAAYTGPKYKGIADCFVKTVRNEGPLALYKGFLPNFVRLGGWNIVMFVSLEQIKKAIVEPARSARTGVDRGF